MSESTLTALQAQKQQTATAYAEAQATRKAAEAAEVAASIAMSAARDEAGDAEGWLDLPKAARKRVRAAGADDIAAFAKALYGSQEDRWAALGWRKGKDDRSSFRRATLYSDTNDGTAARILHRRGAAWCDAVEVPDAQR